MRANAVVCSAMIAMGMLSVFPACADSLLTSKVKAKLAVKSDSSFATIRVSTDDEGIVWLSGTAPTADACSRAAQIASNIDGVTAVHNKIVVHQ
jgi:hyperosmotically inducible periplasmic protein